MSEPCRAAASLPLTNSGDVLRRGTLLSELPTAAQIPATASRIMCQADASSDVFVAHTSSHKPEMLPPPPSQFAPRMMANELVTAIQRCSIGDKEQLQAAAELAAIFTSELLGLLVARPHLQPQIFRQALPAVQHFLHRTKIISAADTGNVLRSANRLLGAAAAFVALGEPCSGLLEQA